MSTGKPMVRKLLEPPACTGLNTGIPVFPGERVYSTEPMTLQEVGEALGLTRERIRQIEAKALMKAAHLLRERGIGADILEDDLGATASLLASMGAMSRNMRR